MRTNERAEAIKTTVEIKFIIFPWILTKTVWLEATYTH